MLLLLLQQQQQQHNTLPNSLTSQTDPKPPPEAPVATTTMCLYTTVYSVCNHAVTVPMNSFCSCPATASSGVQTCCPQPSCNKQVTNQSQAKGNKPAKQLKAAGARCHN